MKKFELPTSIKLTTDVLNVPVGYEMNYKATPIVMDMTNVVPHAYVVGMTGSGKSSVTKFMVKQLVENYPADRLEIWYLDNQGLEVDEISDLKHVSRTADNVQDAFDALEDLVDIMEIRVGYLKSFKVKDIKKYNEKVEEPEKMPFIVCFIDEMRPVMNHEDLKGAYCDTLKLIVQTARKVGIHLIISTQRASEGHLDRELRTAITGKIGLRVSDDVESRNVIGDKGCETIRADEPGEGFVAGFMKKTRFYTPYVSEESFEALIEKYGK
ncbi:MAG: FtsK/SpoIIIE domain-containing protein [Turicibacter sp.]|nr:FtsK/SpoIIIE domain-containing protein [Turicibacter sp.]